MNSLEELLIHAGRRKRAGKKKKNCERWGERERLREKEREKVETRFSEREKARGKK